MTDLHHNIFYYYRGPNQLKQGPYDQQLEDNTTKALANTLKHCSPPVALMFLKECLGIETNKKKVEVELQKPTIGTEIIRRTSQRLLLGLVDKAEKNEDFDRNKLAETTNGDSQPDAWLYGEDFVVLIESKVGKASLELDQMQRHFQKLLKDALQPPKYQVRTWAEVHKFFVNLLPKLRDEKDKWLVEQFAQYLEWKGMTEFTGFEEGMFEFFVHSEKDPDTKKWIRNTIGLFAEKVLPGLQALNAVFYKGYHVGNFGAADDHFWVAFGSEKFREVAHQTIALYDYGLDIFVNVELSPAIKKLKKKMRDEKQKFRAIISELPGPFRVQVEERKLKQASIFDYYVVAKLEGGVHKDYHPGHYGLKDPQSNGFDYLETLLEQIPFPYLSVRKRLDRKRVLELSKKGDALIDEVLGIMRKFHPLVEFING